MYAHDFNLRLIEDRTITHASLVRAEDDASYDLLQLRFSDGSAFVIESHDFSENSWLTFDWREEEIIEVKAEEIEDGSPD